MCKVGIIGVGKVGTRLAEELARSRMCSEIHLWNRSIAKLRGTLSSLRVWSHIERLESVFHELAFSRVNSLDLIILAIKDDYDPRILMDNEEYPSWFPVDLRTVGLRSDAPLVFDICRRLGDFGGRILVVTNPVDILCTLMKRWIPNAEIIGLGCSIDSSRLAFSLSGYQVKRVAGTQCLVGGEHGRNLVVIKSLWSSQARRVFKAHILADSARIGVRIVKDLGFTLQDCCSVFASDIAWIIGRNQEEKVKCLSVWNDVASVGWPVTRGKNGCKLTVIRTISEGERKKLHAIERDLSLLAGKIQREMFPEFRV